MGIAKFSVKEDSFKIKQEDGKKVFFVDLSLGKVIVRENN